jgi:hypothetical protein
LYRLAQYSSKDVVEDEPRMAARERQRQRLKRLGRGGKQRSPLHDNVV